MVAIGAPFGAPTLTLVPDPAVGNAPVHVNVTATAASGTPPYTLTLCFGTADHTSPPPTCGNRVANWTGAMPLPFGHLYALPGDYSVVGVLTDARGGSVGSTALIVVTGAIGLASSATESTSAGAAPLTVTFVANVTGGTLPVTIQWTFGDGTSGSGIAGVPTSHTYLHAGGYGPVLTVRDAAGHEVSQALATVTVSSSPTTSVGFGGAIGGGSLLWPAFAVFVVAALGVFGGVHWLRVRRWRREGNDLVNGLGDADSRPELHPPPP